MKATGVIGASLLPVSLERSSAIAQQSHEAAASPAAQTGDQIGLGLHFEMARTCLGGDLAGDRLCDRIHPVDVFARMGRLAG